ncbi:MAG: hypothetical protein N2595_02655 [bacterium]|nr:hypothetical protein [bacterium]
MAIGNRVWESADVEQSNVRQWLAQQNGSGIYATKSTMIITRGADLSVPNGLVRGHEATKAGEALCAVGSDVRVGEGSEIRYWRADGVGGGIYAKNGRLELLGARIETNWWDAHGRGMGLEEVCVALLSNVVFSGDKADGDGGALYLSGSSTSLVVTVVGCVVTNNVALGNREGMRVWWGTRVDGGNCTIGRNINGDKGDAIAVEEAQVALYSLYASNVAERALTRLYENIAQEGGALYAFGQSARCSSRGGEQPSGGGRRRHWRSDGPGKFGQLCLARNILQTARPS